MAERSTHRIEPLDVTERVVKRHEVNIQGHRTRCTQGPPQGRGKAPVPEREPDVERIHQLLRMAIHKAIHRRWVQPCVCAGGRHVKRSECPGGLERSHPEK